MMSFYHLTCLLLVFDTNEFIALWLHHGRIVLAFDCGSGKAELESIHHFNDDRWHQIEIRRIENNATLLIDGHSQGSIIPPGACASLVRNNTKTNEQENDRCLAV
jgi:hypothetical protein